MQLPFSSRWLLPLALFIGLALRVPGWFTQDFKDKWTTFEPDESQHVHAAVHRYNAVHKGEPIGDYSSPPWNVRGYGHLMAYVASGWYGLVGETPGFRDFLLLGRQLSTVFALLLILTVWLLGRASGLSPPFAGVAALLMACCDANATYSHYCLPASGYIFWCYLAVLGAMRLALGRISLGNLSLLALGTAGALAFKFDVLPLAWGGLLLLYLAGTRRIPWWYVPAGIGLVASVVLVFTYGWSWNSIKATFNTLSELNRAGVPQDDHWRDNLIVYPAGVLAGIGLPVFGLAVWGLRQLFWGAVPAILTGQAAGAGEGQKEQGWASVRPWLLVYLVGWLASEFLVRWSVDTAFIRRVNIFMPAVCLLAAYALQRLRSRSWLAPAVLVYTLVFGIVGQSNHWFDTRYAMREYVNKELPADAKIAISGYVMHQGLRRTKFFMDIDWDYAVLHETYYSRYYKSMTTPFGLPACPAGVYNPGKAGECERMQALLTGTDPEARLLKAFRPLNLFPERLLYAHFFGYYETFLGSTLVFEKVL